MSYLQAIVLGVVQGLTEFLPVSSSGHLILMPRLLGWADQGLAFDAAVHLGTLAALLAYFRAELGQLAGGGRSRRLLPLLAAASLPALGAGWLFAARVERELRSPVPVAVALAGWAVVMWVADRRARPARPGAGESLAEVGWAPGLAVGLAQALALVPGTSRSGVTIAVAMLVGLDRPTAARFSFLLGIPVTAAAGGYKTLGLVAGGLPPDAAGPLVAAVAAAFLSGWLAVWFLVAYLTRRSLLPFVVYRLALAAAILALFARE